MFLRNAWYVAAWANELEVGKLFARTILSDPVLLFRTADGTPAALADRCPHRFAPLHLGKLHGNVVECAYHGLRFDCSGVCVKNPHGSGVIPKAAVVKKYPLVERHRAVWIWMGAPERADPQAIPDYSFISRAPASAVFTGYLRTACNYELATDNIMDLSHADFLHLGSLDANGALAATPPKVAEDGAAIECNWWLPSSRVLPVFAPHLADASAPVDQWFEVRWDPPALMRLRAGVTPSGRPREEGLDTRNLHLMTPETDRSTHYFFCSTRNFKTDDSAVTEQTRIGVTAVFATQDKPILEAQQMSMGTTDFYSLKPVLLAGDAGTVHVRRVLAKLIEEERATELEKV
jgi:phenylpropionate dioxygenase-like ring-hydroxylating dioxygenase large terminal subunit